MMNVQVDEGTPPSGNVVSRSGARAGARAGDDVARSSRSGARAAIAFLMSLARLLRAPCRRAEFFLWLKDTKASVRSGHTTFLCHCHRGSGKGPPQHFSADSACGGQGEPQWGSSSVRGQRRSHPRDLGPLAAAQPLRVHHPHACAVPLKGGRRLARDE